MPTARFVCRRPRSTSKACSSKRCCAEACLSQQRITAATGWHVHHIVRRVDGGSSARANLVMVHPVCHQQIHSRGLTVKKPAPTWGF
nr:HNH endonuclease signature motif containing protein [Caballeronia calidae]